MDLQNKKLKILIKQFFFMEITVEQVNNEQMINR